jgi:cytochrome oxidase Cu insertion factor (SCO1/SenC/PrrC family)
MPSSANWVSRLTAALLAGGVVAAAIASELGAHDAKQHVLTDDRPELSFGRSVDFDYDPPAPGSYRLPAIKPAADGTVLDTAGRPLRLHDAIAGRIAVLAFIYTRCTDPQGCPLSMGLLYDLAYVAGQDPAIGDSLRLMAMSFDVEHDRPEVMADYAAETETAAGDNILFLTAESKAVLDPILAAYDQPIGRKVDPQDAFGPLTHQLRVYLIDRQGQIRNIYSLGFLDPRLVITDVRTLLLEERGKPPEG